MGNPSRTIGYLKIKIVECGLFKDLVDGRPSFIMEYGENKFRTNTCQDGLEECIIPLVKGHWEVFLTVRDKSITTGDDVIGRIRIFLDEDVISGHHCKFWPLHNQIGRYTGIVRLKIDFLPEMGNPSRTVGYLKIKIVECGLFKDLVEGLPSFTMEYGENKFRTNTCQDGLEECSFPLVKGHWEVFLNVRDENITTGDDVIGRIRIFLDKDVIRGRHTKFWPLHNKIGRYTGIVRLKIDFLPETATTSTLPSSIEPSSPTTFHPIEGLKLRVTVVECKELRHNSRDIYPCVCLKYADCTVRTKNYCTDDPRNPAFGDRFVIQIFKGLYEMSVSLWNKNDVGDDDLMGRGRILLGQALTGGYDNCVCELKDGSGRHAGALQLTIQLIGKSTAFVLEDVSTCIDADPSKPTEEEEYGMDVRPGVVPSYTTSVAHVSLPQGPPYAPNITASQRNPILYEHQEACPDLYVNEEYYSCPLSELIEEHDFIFERC